MQNRTNRTRRQQGSIKAWYSIYPAKIDRGDIPKKMTPALKAFLDQNPYYSEKVEAHHLRPMSEVEQIAAIAGSWCNLRKIKNPIEKVEIMAVALDVRAYDLLSVEAKRSMIIQTIMLRKDGHYIKRIERQDLNEEAVMAAVRRDFEIFSYIASPTEAMISAAVTHFEKNIRKNIYAASLIYEAVAPHLKSETRAFAEREFVLNNCEAVIDVEGGNTAMLEQCYQDIGGYFGLSQDEHIRKVAEALFRMARRLTDQDWADEIQQVLVMKYEIDVAIRPS